MTAQKFLVFLFDFYRTHFNNMSRSKKKHAVVHICFGNNAPFYKAARRHLRSLNNQELKRVLANTNTDEIDEVIKNYQNKHDRKYDKWFEPTDACVVWEGKQINKYIGDKLNIKKLKRK